MLLKVDKRMLNLDQCNLTAKIKNKSKIKLLVRIVGSRWDYHHLFHWVVIIILLCLIFTTVSIGINVLQWPIAWLGGAYCHNSWHIKTQHSFLWQIAKTTLPYCPLHWKKYRGSANKDPPNWLQYSSFFPLSPAKHLKGSMLRQWIPSPPLSH